MTNLWQKYLKPSAPWWSAVLVTPVLVMMEVEPTVIRKLQPVLKPVVAVTRFAHTQYRVVFPDTDEGFYLEMVFLVAVGFGGLLELIL